MGRALEAMLEADHGLEPNSVFLGGTMNNPWREELIKLLTVPYFNPIVSTWDEEARQVEETAKESAPFLIYVITPEQKNIYSFVEMGISPFRYPKAKTIICKLENTASTFTEEKIKELENIKSLFQGQENVAFVESLQQIAEMVNV